MFSFARSNTFRHDLHWQAMGSTNCRMCRFVLSSLGNGGHNLNPPQLTKTMNSRPIELFPFQHSGMSILILEDGHYPMVNYLEKQFRTRNLREVKWILSWDKKKGGKISPIFQNPAFQVVTTFRWTVISYVPVGQADYIWVQTRFCLWSGPPHKRFAALQNSKLT